MEQGCASTNAFARPRTAAGPWISQLSRSAVRLASRPGGARGRELGTLRGAAPRGGRPGGSGRRVQDEDDRCDRSAGALAPRAAAQVCIGSDSSEVVFAFFVRHWISASISAGAPSRQHCLRRKESRGGGPQLPRGNATRHGAFIAFRDVASQLRFVCGGGHLTRPPRLARSTRKQNWTKLGGSGEGGNRLPAAHIYQGGPCQEHPGADFLGALFSYFDQVHPCEASS